MIKEKPELINQKYGEWTVVKWVKGYYYLCQCKCGVQKVIYSYSLTKAGNSGCRSCSVKKHGMSTTPIYKVWNAMRQRCQNKNDKGYSNYGGRGIKVCERWNEFENFFADMGDQPKGKQIDRIDNDGNYCLENCRWATPSENCNNQKKTRDWGGYTTRQLADITNLPLNTVYMRLRSGWSVDKLLKSL